MKLNLYLYTCNKIISTGKNHVNVEQKSIDTNSYHIIMFLILIIFNNVINYGNVCVFFHLDKYKAHKGITKYKR